MGDTALLYRLLLKKYLKTHSEKSHDNQLSLDFFLYFRIMYFYMLNIDDKFSFLKPNKSATSLRKITSFNIFQIKFFPHKCP